MFILTCCKSVALKENTLTHSFQNHCSKQTKHSSKFFLRKQLGCHTEGRNCGSGSPCKTKSLNFPPSVGYHPQFSSPPLTKDNILEKKVFLIAFRQILPKILPLAIIFSNIIMTNLKKLIGNKSLNTKQCPAGLSP